MTTATATEPGTTTFRLIPIDELDPSRTNPRKHFDKALLSELVESIREKGVLQPILVRSLDKGYEIVAGERRWRAAKEAGLTEIPATVRELTDLQVLEVQITENLIRADLHPLEEAEGYETLTKGHKYSVEDLAAKVGKSTAYIYARLKLCALVADCRKAFTEKGLPPSHALLVARLPAADQPKALKAIKGYDDTWLPYREAVRTIHRSFMLELKNAPFDTASELLVPKAGACTVCPKRSGNQPGLFEDIGSKDTCTDAHCFDAKRDAAWTLQTSAAKADGKTVLSEKEARKVWPNQYSGVDPKSGFIDLEAHNYEDPNGRSWRQTLGKAALAITLARNPHTGAAAELVSRTEAMKAAREKGLKWAQPKERSSKTRSPGTTRSKTNPQDEEARDAAIKTAVGLIVTAAETSDANAQSALRLLIADDARICSGLKEIYERRGMKAPSRGLGGEPKELLAAAKSLDTPRLVGLLCELSLRRDGDPYEDGVFSAACDVFDIDLKKLTKQAKASLPKPEEKKPKAKTAAPAKKGKPTKKATAAPTETRTPAEIMKDLKAKKRASKPRLGKKPRMPEPSVSAPAGTCKKCGCQEHTPCEGGCGWTDSTQTLCTACAGDDS